MQTAPFRQAFSTPLILTGAIQQAGASNNQASESGGADLGKGPDYFDAGTNQCRVESVRLGLDYLKMRVGRRSNVCKKFLAVDDERFLGRLARSSTMAVTRSRSSVSAKMANVTFLRSSRRAFSLRFQSGNSGLRSGSQKMGAFSPRSTTNSDSPC
jgi:hypothetical protein